MAATLSASAFLGLTVVTLITLVCAQSNESSVSVTPRYASALQANILEFFRIRNNDGLLIKWAHAVNSQQKLEETLQDDDVHMIECDVILNASGTPILAHPPKTDSDLTVQQLLDAVVLRNVKKGVKLDFKVNEAVAPTLRLLRQHFSNSLKTPLLLNADILPGPGGSPTKALNSTNFVETVLQLFPFATLSLGWTTGDGSTADCVRIMQYDVDMVEEMMRLVANLKNVTNVTFPVSARHLPGSQEALRYLLQGSPKSYTLTVWSLFGDALASLTKLQRKESIVELRSLRRTLDLSRVFYDLDPSLLQVLTDRATVLQNCFTTTVSSLLLLLIFARRLDD